VYRKFFGLKDKPFEITPDPRFLYRSDIHKEALANLKYAVREGKGFTVVTGEVGTGKTTLIHSLLSTLDGNVRTAYIFNPNLRPTDFLNYICDDLGLKSDELRSRGQSLTMLHNFLLECYEKNEKVYLIIDEAQSLSPRLLEEVRLLTNLETAKSKLLHLILMGQPELDNMLADPGLRQLKQRITIRHRIAPLDEKDTRDYILHRLKIAGARHINIFDEGALKEIYRYSSGIPRLINIVCDNALITGFSREEKKITRSIIKEVIRDLEGPAYTRKSAFNWKIALLLALIVVLVVVTLDYFILNTK
jgi:general secretion pathway protein A